jgi:hypothetical protein
VERTGARWNPYSAEGLAKAARVRAAALASDRRPMRAGVQRRPRQGEIVQTIIEVLGESDAPLRPVEIHQAVEARLGRAVGLHTVVGRLSAGAANVRSPIVRIARGRYALIHGDRS